MRDIYAGAEEVILFLGDGVNHRISTAYLTQPLPSPVVFWNDSRDDSHLQLFRDSSKALWKQKSWNAFYLICLIRILSQEGDFSFAKAAIEAVNGQRRRELFELLRRLAVEPWWHRIWVVQEVAISPKVTVRYGNVTAPWDMFVQVAENTQSHDYSLTLEAEYAKVLSLFTRQVLDIENLRGEWEANKGTDLLSLLQRFSDRKATDERDKVYALLGLARRHQFLVPDYSTSIDNLYQSTAITLIGSYGNLAPLSGDLKRKNSRSLASWIPDWSAIFDKSDRERMVLYRTYHACSNWRITVFEPPEKYLNYVAREMGRLVTSP
ncbi:hypothetical protein GQX73_g5087 [Xylaria multiplex]|uniref:Uncharacterized protein n=1 Tax=Xylaria multiplex TaxID=323545 RepID=A0A7C8MM09_9PEZI|nr:hypothetical protein GQX73_g5087 [Xylaria multiplex]